MFLTSKNLGPAPEAGQCVHHGKELPKSWLVSEWKSLPRVWRSQEGTEPSQQHSSIALTLALLAPQPPDLCFSTPWHSNPWDA